MTNPNQKIYTDGVEVLAPCVYTATNAAEALETLTQDIYVASDSAWKAYGSGQAQEVNDSFMDDIAEAFEE